MSSLVTINHTVLPEHLLYVVFALRVSGKNSLDSFLTRSCVTHLNFLSVQIILLPNKHWVLRRGLCLAPRPGCARSAKPPRSRAQSPWGQGSSTCAQVRVLCTQTPLPPHSGAWQHWGHQGPLSGTSPAARGAPEPLSSPAASARNRGWQSNSKCQQLTTSFSLSQPG